VPPLEPLPQVPTVDLVVPPTPVVKEMAAVALPPPPRPVPAPAKKVESKPEAKKPPKPVQARRAEAQQGSPRPPQQRSGAQTTAALGSASTGASAASRAGWQGAIVAALNRAKRPQQDSGTASVRFSVDRGGRVLSASLAGSTGVASLDQEAVSLVRRANIPAPPANVPGEAFTFTVPIRFTPQ
jgi:protein TonB